MGTQENDHDLLIRLDTNVNNIIEILKQYAPLEERVRKLENATTEIPTLKDEVNKLRGKSDTWNIFNSIGVAIAGLISVIFK